MVRQSVESTIRRSDCGGRTDLLFCPMTAPTYAEKGVATLLCLHDLQHLAYRGS